MDWYGAAYLDDVMSLRAWRVRRQIGSCSSTTKGYWSWGMWTPSWKSSGTNSETPHKHAELKQKSGSSLQGTRLVAEYLDEFQGLAGKLRGWPEQLLVYHF